MLASGLPDTLTALLAAFAPCFTVPTYRTFCALAAGFLTQPGARTITGMLTGAGLAGRHHHDLAYRFFARARWCPDQLGLVVCDLITTWLLADDTPLLVAADDTLWRRRGPRLHGAAWHHDGNGPGRHRPAWGHRWVVLGVIVRVPGCSRPICLPILARLWRPGDPERTPLALARELLDLLVAHLGDRPVHLVGDAAYIGGRLRGLPATSPSPPGCARMPRCTRHPHPANTASGDAPANTVRGCPAWPTSPACPPTGGPAPR